MSSLAFRHLRMSKQLSRPPPVHAGYLRPHLFSRRASRRPFTYIERISSIEAQCAQRSKSDFQGSAALERMPMPSYAHDTPKRERSPDALQSRIGTSTRGAARSHPDHAQGPREVGDVHPPLAENSARGRRNHRIRPLANVPMLPQSLRTPPAAPQMPSQTVETSPAALPTWKQTLVAPSGDVQMLLQAFATRSAHPPTPRPGLAARSAMPRMKPQEVAT